MKSFYGYPTRLKSSIPVWLISTFRSGRKGFAQASQRFARASRANRFLALSGCLGLSLLLVWAWVKPGHFSQTGQSLWQAALLKTEGIKLNWSGDQSAAYTLHAPHEQWIPEAGVRISTAMDLGRTAITVNHRAVTIDQRPSIRKVVGIHPEHDEDLDAEMLFTYTDAELGDLDETQLILYSSTDEGVTWQPHLNSVRDPATNTIRVEGVRHFSLWTAAGILAVQGPGCVTTGIGAWWRSDNGCSPSLWTDFSGNGYHVNGVNNPVFNSTGANFNPLLKLSGSYYTYTVGIFRNSPGIVNTKVFAVTVPVSGQLTVPWSEKTSNGYFTNLYAPWNNNYSYFDAPYGHRVYNVFTTAGGQYGVPNIVAGERTQNNMAIRTNGKVQNFPGSYGGSFLSNTTENYVGAVSGYPSSGGTGLAEVIVYRDASSITAVQVQKIESYLALKYGITLDQTTPRDYLAGDGTKMWDAAGNATFKYNIAGLGRDDCQSLHQKQSKSVNASQFITFATGTSIKTENALNTSGVVADKSFLVWADNNLAANTTVAVAGTNASDRMSRVWRVDKTNWTDQNITIKAAGYANRYLLIHPTSATFATAPSQEILLDFNGQATFNSSLLPDGAYFTIGNIVKGPACLSAGIGGWWRADQEMDGTSWVDYSGNGHNAVNAGAPVPQTTGANYNPFVKFFSNHYKYTEGIFKNAPGIVNTKVFTVVIPVSGQYSEPWGEWMSNSQPYHIHAPHANGNIYHDAPYGHRIQAGFTAQGGQFGVPNIIAGERTATNMSIRTNGRVLNQAGNYSGTFTANTDLNYLGAYNGLASSGGCGLAEVIVYRDASALTGTDVQKIESYLALKYGITLDQSSGQHYLASDGSKMWDATVNANYANNIAGLGRDNCQLLHQKQSRSSNPAQFVTIAVGGIAASNPANTGAVTNDKSFLVWGDNGLAINSVVAVTATNVTERMSRVWRVDKTNWADQTITFQATGYANRYLLIHSTSATFATAPTQEILLDGNGSATFNSSLLPDGAYFTFGSVFQGPGCVNVGIGGWWRADQFCSGTEWKDYSGNDHTATANGAPAFNTTGANFNPLVKFNGTNYQYTDGVFKNAPGIVNSKVFTVVVPVSGQYTEPWGEYTTNANNYHIHGPHANGNIYHDAPYGYRIQAGFVAQGGQFDVPNIIAGERTQTNMSIRTNGKVLNQPGSYTGTFTSHTNLNYLGASYGLSSSGNSGVAEVIVYRDATNMTATDVQKIESYLALKYGITLDQTTARDYLAGDGTTKMWDATANATFKYNIAGLGRDNCQLLHQKQSKSVNSSQFITFALGDSIAASNGNNPKTITNDKSFLVWGDNNSSRFTSVAITGSSNVTGRMARVWRVDKTNWADQNVTIKAAGYPNRYLLIHNTSATFATAPNQEILLDGTGSATFSSSLLPDGAYFTIGDALKGPGCVNAGIGAWWKADYQMAATYWNDYSGNDKNAVNAGAPVPQATGANYNPFVKFFSNHYKYDEGVFKDAPGIVNTKLFTVVIPIAGQYSEPWGEWMSNGQPYHIHAPHANGNIYQDAPYGHRIQTGFVANGGQYDVPNIIAGERTQTNMSIRTNGKVVNQAGSYTGTFTANTTLNYIGAYNGLASSGGCGLAEVIVYRDATNMTATDVQKVESYLALKYGITLDQTTPRDYLATDGTTKMWDATANGAYKYNIAGLGRDLCQQLHQKQSKSVNPKQFITFALGDSIASSNGNNVKTVTNDKSFFVWADDNGSRFTTAAVSASNVTQRMTRVWKVDKTNWADQTVTFKAIGFPNRYLLIHNTSATFATAPTQEIALDANGAATFNSSLLPDGAYFTIGDAILGPGCVNAGVGAWWKADYDMDATHWNDYSGNDKYAAAAGVPTPLVSGANFNPMVKFNSNHYDYTGNGIFENPITAVNTRVFVVSIPVNGQYTAAWGERQNNGQNMQLLAPWSDNTIYHDAPYGNRVQQTFSTMGGIYDVPNLVVGIRTASNMAIRLQGKQIVNNNANYSTGYTTVAASHLGAVPGTASSGGTGLAEVIVYRDATNFTPTDLQKVESYLALKYGITLDQTTPRDYLAGDGTTKMWDATANVNYRYNIAGMGKDRCQQLHQKMSRSVNPNQFITFSLGNNIPVSNATNLESVTNDKSFFVWGDDNGQLQASISVNASTVSERSGRIWRVDKTNWADQPITFKAQGYPNRALLISYTDASFSGVPDQEIVLDGTGSATFSSSLLPDGAYFTLGNVLIGPGNVNVGVSSWFDASEMDEGIMVNGTGWTDKSGWHRDMYEINPNSDPEVVQSMINFNKGAFFDSDDVVYQPSYGTAFTQGEYFAVGQTKDFSNRGPLADFGGQVGQGAGHYAWSNNSIYELFGTNDRVGYNPQDNSITDAAPGLTVTGTTYNQLNWGIYNVASATNDWFSGINGLAKAVRTTNTPTFLTSSGNANGNMHIGWREGYYFYGNISEVIHYNRKLTAPERQKVHSYLALKYGITLDQTSPYNYVATNGTVYWDGTANSAFKYNIAGVGRDNFTNLNQKQSKSINAGQFITMAVGAEIAASNLANASTIPTDRSYLVWGDNNASQSVPVAVTASNVTERMARVWRVDKTANWADQNITFKAQGYPNRYLLIHNTSATFATAPDQEIQLDTFGRATFNTSLLPDGAYFTIGDAVKGPGCVNLGSQLWLKGDYGLSSGAIWNDFSGNENDFTQTVTGERATFFQGNAATNFNPGLLFANTNNLERATGLLTNGGGTVVAAVANNNVASTWADLYNQDIDDPTFGKYAGTGNFYVWDNGVFANSVPLTFIQNQNHVAMYDYGTTANSYTAYLDGKSQSLVHGAVPSIDPGIAYIGGENTGETWLGNVYEMAIYNRELTAPELQRVNSYFGLKYGITLDQTTATNYLASDGTVKMWDATVNATYKYNIAGIGRDNCSTLNQKQSHSGNASQFVTMAIGDSIAINNAGNPATITNDKSFLVWGDDNGSQTTSVAVAATNVTERMTRVWRVDKTNWADQNITFKAQGYGNRYLIISNSSATFATVNQEILLDASGKATFNSSLLPDGAYFTIGDALKGPGCVNLGVKLWFRPDYDMTSAAGKVTQWADYSGNDVLVTAPTVARQPTYVASMLNFNPGATFAGGSDGQVLKATISSMSGNTPYTIFAVHKPDNTTSNLFAIGNPTNNQSIAYHPNYGGGTRLLYHFGDDLPGGVPRAGWQLNTFKYDNLPVLPDRYIYDEGKQIAVGTTNNNNVPANPTFSLGGYDNRTGAAGEEYDGDLVEFAVYSQSLSAADRNRVESYLALKYGITLDQSGLGTSYTAGDGLTKMWDALSNIGYNNDIAGIGRDNCQALYQKQSKSVNADDIVTMGLGGIAADNVSNTGTLTDKNFLVWANNNGAISWQVGESPASRVRLTREWKIDETGTIGTMKVQVPDNGSSLTAKLPGEVNGAIYLLVDADGDFSSGATSVAMALNGTNWEADYDFSDGQYFTFATQLPAAPGCVVDNLNLWLKANAGTSSTTDNDVLDLWADQTPNGYDATQTTVAEKPSFQSDSLNLFNFNSTIGFSGLKDFVNTTMPLMDKNAYTIFSVLKRNVVGNYSGVFSQNMSGDAGQPATTYLTTTNSIGINAVNQGPTGVFVTDPLTGQFLLRNTGNAGTVNMVMNGGSPNASGAYPGTPSGTTTGYYVGRHNTDLNLTLNGNIAELAVYKTGALTTAQVNAIESYFAVKYGLMLGHDYVSGGNATIWDIGATGGYDSRVFGIGRDDCQALLQKQSKSAVSGALVTLGNGNLIVGNNADNSSTFSADASFLMAGDNNGSNGWQLAETPANRQRLSREWRVYETGTIGSVKIRVPDNSSSATTKLPGEVSTVYLLTDADGDFSSGSTETPMSLNGTDWEANIDLTNGQYFTFATNVPPAPGCVVTGLRAWLKANTGTVSNVMWTDNSQNGNNAVGRGSATVNTGNALNFNPSVVFAGSTTNEAYDFSSDVFTAGNNSFTVFNVGTGVEGTLMSHGVNTTNQGLFLRPISPNGSFDFSASGFGLTGIPSTARISRFTYTAGTSTRTFSTNRNAVVSNSAATLNYVSGVRIIGHDMTSGSFKYTGNLPELIVYTNVNLTATEIQKIESYLALKYGITLDQTSANNYLAGSGAVIWNATTNAAYSNDIAGIGRDDCQGLEQKQSKSVNSDALITMGNGNTIATTNGLNGNGFNFDASFMLWGNNNGAIAWQTTEAPSGRQRLTREWKIAETGTVGSVKIRVPDNGSALASKLPAKTSTIFLLVDDDGDFSSGATEIPMAANGTDWDLDYDLLDGQYITFATETCNPLITGNPVDVALCVGGNATFSVTGFGSGLTYQWQESTNGGGTFTNIAGATSASYTKSSVTGAMDGYQYRAVVSNGCPPAATSTAATMTVNTPPVISGQPANLSVCDGAVATFGVMANGSGLTLQWQQSTDGGANYTNLSGETAPNLTFTATGAMNGRKYRVVITGTCTPVVTSNAVTLTVNAPPTIITQPANDTICAGQNAIFTVAATGTNLTYQWQQNTGSGFVNIAGATGASYTKTGTTGAMDGYQYQVIVSGDCPLPVTSNSVVLTVNTLPAITTQPTAQTVCAGVDATFTVVATGTGLTYQWQESTNGGGTFTNISGATTASYTKAATTSIMSGYQYRVVISGTCTPTVTSSAVALTVNTAPAITGQPAAATVCAGVNAVFSVTATGTGLSYQWQENTGASFVNIAGATSATYTKTGTTGAMSGYQYQVIVTGTCPSPVTSNPVLLTVNTLPAITIQPSAVTVCAGTDATFSVTATGTGLSYQWQESTNGGATFSNIGGATTASFTKTGTTGVMSGYQYRVIVSGTCTPPVTSAAVTLTVNLAPGITSQPSAQVVCAGQNATFSVTAAGTSLSYQWQENTGSGFVNIAGATSASYTKAGTTVAMSGYQYQVIITGICPSPVTSSAVGLTVNALPSITSQPTAQTVCAGQTATFSVAATGTGITYQWQEDAGGGFMNLSGATGASYTTAATTTAMSGRQYRVVVTGTCTPTLTSNAVTLTVNALPAISSQPLAQTVCAGANATFTVTATGTGLSYQWQENTGSGFVDIAGATSASYTKASTTSAMSGYLYRVIVSGTCSPTVTSAAVSLTVNTAPAITSQPVAATVCTGANASFTVVATGTGLSYQWQENTGSGFVSIAGATSAAYTKAATTTAMNGYLYQVIVTGTCPSPLTSTAVSLTVNALPAITTQPTAQTACAGENATFSVIATGTALTYQWQESTNGGATFSNLAGETNATFVNMAVTGGMNGRQYRVIVSGTCSPAITSNAVALTVNVSPSITTQPSSATVCAGQNATFTVAGTGTFLTYQWQESTNGGGTFTNIAGATNPSYTKASTTSAMNGYQYRVVLNGPCVPLNSDVVLLTVNIAPAITTQPTNKTVCAGNDATFAVVATGTGLTYQWQENTGSGFVNIAGATGSSYTKTSATPAMNGYQYQVIINGTCTPPVTSTLVTLTVNALPAITAQPNSTTLCAGNNAIFSATATGSGLSYQWQESTNGGGSFSNIPGATASIFIKSSVTTAMSGYQYRVIVSGTCTPSVTSNVANLTVNAVPAITTQPASVITCEGANVIFSATATGNGLTYQWQENTGSGFVDIGGATSSSYTKTGITNAMSGYQYQLVVSGACAPPATSNPATLTVTTAPLITGQPADLSVCSGANATFSVTASGTGVAYQWQVNDGFGWVDIPGATNASYTKVGVPISYNGYQYHVIVGGACPPALTSSTATLTITQGPAISTQPSSLTACVASNASFSVVATGPGLTYQWQENTGSGFINISGANSDNYTKTGITNAMNGYLYRVLVTGICAPTIPSNVATLSVEAPPSISSQPASAAVCAGNNASFSVTAVGNGLTYQWQENTGSGWLDIAGETGATLSRAAVTTGMNGYQYHVLVTGGCSPPATSNAAILTVNTSPAITTQPADVAGCVGVNALFSVAATGSGLAYQWQESINGGGSFSNIAGATSAAYTKTGVTGAMNNYQYRVIVSGTCSPAVTSNPAILTVNTAPVIVTQPSSPTTCIGDNAIFAVMTTGSGLSYQWQENTGSGFVNIPGATSDIYTKTGVTAAMNGYTYKVLVNGTCSPAVTSATVTLTVIAAPAITTQPVAVTLCAGGNATFTATATGDALTYQWQENTGSGFVNIAGATSASYTKSATTSAMNGYQYHVIVSGTCAPAATSSNALLTVNTAPAITTQPAAVTVCAGANATFNVAATGSGLAYQWQENTGSGFVNLAGETSASLTRTAVTAGMNGYLYRVIVSGICTPPVTSGGVALTVNTAPAITTPPAATTVCTGLNATFTVVATGTGLSYQWQENTGSGYVDLAGATLASFTKMATTTAMNGYLYRVIISGTCTPPATSAGALLTINTAPSITTPPAAVTVCAGVDASFTVVASGSGLTYQWQENTGSGFVNITGATGTSYTKVAPTGAMDGYLYRVVITGTCTPPATSTAVAMTVQSGPSITTQPASVAVNEGLNAIFNVVATGTGLSYQWQENTGSGFVNLAGATSASFTKTAVTAVMNGYKYRVIINGACLDAVTSNMATLTVNLISPVVNVKAILGGAYDDQTHKMRDQLRVRNLIPMTQPYNGAQYGDFAYNGTETIGAGVLAVTGDNAIVDWVLLELRNATTPSIVVARKAALIQRDGDVVSASDGTSLVSFGGTAGGNYYVVLRHRNHLGVMTSGTLALSGTPTVVDFTSTSTGNYQLPGATGSPHAQSLIENDTKRALWAGNMGNGGSSGNQIIYQGNNSDLEDLYFRVVLDPGNGDFLPTYIVAGYDRTDGNLDGDIIYQGNAADADLPFFTVFLFPTNTSSLPNFVVFQQVP